MNRTYEANELRKEFPEETKGFSLLEIASIWSDYSQSMAAGWLNPTKEEAEHVFSQFRSI